MRSLCPVGSGLPPAGSSVTAIAVMPDIIAAFVKSMAGTSLPQEEKVPALTMAGPRLRSAGTTLLR